MTDYLHELRKRKFFEKMDEAKERVPFLFDVPVCPFCGQRPKLILRDVDGYGCVKQVRCTNPACKVRPFTNCFETVKEAKAVWSKRI